MIDKFMYGFLNIVKEQSPNTKVILESYHYGYPGLIKDSYANTMPQIIHNKHVKELNELYLTVSKEFSNVYFLPNSTTIIVNNPNVAYFDLTISSGAYDTADTVVNSDRIKVIMYKNPKNFIEIEKIIYSLRKIF